MYRTHTNGALTEGDAGKEVRLCGWVHAKRLHGGIIFVDIRDRYGLTQIVFDPEHAKEPRQLAESLKSEDVISVLGTVKVRKEKNPRLKTGDIEMFVSELQILNRSATLPIGIDDMAEVMEDTALKYRYLELRKPKAQKRMLQRHLLTKSVRDYFDRNGFLDIETPILSKSTPEGARDYVIPSRIHKGKFYALPQSPQLYKQLLMIAGFDRYMQIARCFRDEDLRADRQPEFTQIDVEMAFIHEEDIYSIIDSMVKEVWKTVLDVDIGIPIPRIAYLEAMSRFGSDRPDMRFAMELQDLTELFRDSEFKVFSDTIKNKGIVKAINVKDGNVHFKRKDLDSFAEFVKIYKAKGLAHIKMADGKPESQILKYISQDVLDKILKTMHTEKNDLLLFVADYPKAVNGALSQLRVHIARKLGLCNEGFHFVWVTEFPLFEWSEDDKRFTSVHHPFTRPFEEDLRFLDSDKGKIRSRAYDLTCNGIELGGGSLRIHDEKVQEKMFEALGISKDEARRKFGFLLDALKYGAPPHGGIAFGLDRIAAVMAGVESIRDVIAFPKNKQAQCLLQDSPSYLDDAQLKELHLK